MSCLLCRWGGSHRNNTFHLEIYFMSFSRSSHSLPIPLVLFVSLLIFLQDQIKEGWERFILHPLALPVASSPAPYASDKLHPSAHRGSFAHQGFLCTLPWYPHSPHHSPREPHHGPSNPSPPSMGEKEERNHSMMGDPDAANYLLCG